MQIQSLGQNFICEVRTATSTNLFAALEDKMKHMSQLSGFRSLVVWKEAPPPPQQELSRESFSVCFIDITAPLGQSCLRKHLLHHQMRCTKEAYSAISLPLKRGSDLFYFTYQMYLCNYSYEGICRKKK